ncbi:hypothetical protein EAF04_008399 [Stromatinia cepivora]|nr:hypothetical protein EAF04_008399 [Stromatinia cepivora]
MSPIKDLLFERKTPLEILVDQLLKLPHSVLVTVPGIEPPPGVEPNFENPDSLRLVLIIICTIFFTLMLICCGIRVWTKLRIMRPVKLHWNDYIAVTGPGTVGLHAWDYSLARLFSTYNLVIGIHCTCLINSSSPRFHKTHNIAHIYRNILCYALGENLMLYWCWNNFALVFSRETISSSGLYHTRTLSVPASCVGLALDVFLFFIPLLAVSKLHMARKKKLGVELIFATGALAIIASILSTVYRVKVNHTMDNTWNIVPVFILTLAELFIGMIIACSWHMSKFIRTYDQKFERMGSRIGYFLCCRCVRKSKEQKESEKTNKNSQGSDTTVETTQADRQRFRKHTKLYPDLDLTDFNVTANGAIPGMNSNNHEESELGNSNGRENNQTKEEISQE